MKLGSSFGRFPASQPAAIIPVHWTDEISGALEKGNCFDSMLGYGMGRSYGDSCLNNQGALLSTRALNRILSFDTKNGIIRCEAGCTLDQILRVIVPAGWFLPVTPGTKFVTVGGAIANDVHGKNHHRAGNFGNHVLSFGLYRSDKSNPILCSEIENSDLFHATIGGLGLTGLIGWAEFQLRQIHNPFIDGKHVRFRGLKQFRELSEAFDQSYEFSVSWVDCMVHKASDVRGIFTVGNFAGPEHSIHPVPKQKSIPFPAEAPEWMLNPFSIKAFNTLYFHRLIKDEKPFIMHYEPFFYPLDGILEWNKMYGKRGFTQYQCILPFSAGTEVMDDIILRIAAAGQGSFLVVLKTFGHKKGQGILSFPSPGITLAMDFPWKGESTRKLLDELDQLVIGSKGRIYPAKDARMKPEIFQKGFPEWQNILPYLDPGFSSSFWRRVIS
jgi:FAD/FMN-containing dehydrogenase